MRDHDEFCDEIKRRKEKLIQKKKQKKRIITTCASFVVCLSVVAAFPWDIFAPPSVSNEKADADDGFKNNVESNTQGGEVSTSFESYSSHMPPSYHGTDTMVESNANGEEATDAVGADTVASTYPSSDYESDRNENVDGTMAETMPSVDDEITVGGVESEVLESMETKEELGTGSPKEDICGSILVQNAAGEDLRYAEVNDCEVFIEMLKRNGIELIYGNETEDSDETATEDVTTNLQQDASEETTFVATEWDSYEVESFDESETFTVDDESADVEIESEAAGEKVTASGDSSSRDRIIFIEIVCSDDEKWVFGCTRGEYEWLYYRMEELLAIYEVK